MPESGPSLVPVVYQVRVVVAGISPLIWRRLLVLAEATIADLPAILQTAFGWSGEHLHHFTVHGAQYGVCYDGGPVFRDDPYRVRLASLGLREGERFSYVYNFFAGWRLDLRVEQITDPQLGRVLSTRVRTCRRRWAPRGDQRICCFLTMRLLMTWLTVASAVAVEIGSPQR